MKDTVQVPTSKLRSNVQSPAGGLAVSWRFAVAVAMLLAFAGDGLRVYFSGDDVMNLYQYVDQGWIVARGLLEFWSPKFYRPLGGVAYMGLYGIFGFNAVAFRIVQFTLLVVNLGLAWCVFRKVLGETRLALFATLLIAYHAAESELYYSFGTIYELLCFTFVMCGVAYWIHSRRDGFYPGPLGLAGLAIIQVLALTAKEMGVILPVLILFWELLNRRMLYRSKPWIEMRAIPALAILGTIVVVYIIGKTTGTEALTTNPLYKPTFTRGAYLTSMTTYLNQLFCTQTLFTHHSTAIFLAGGLLLAAFLRLRVMAFGWLWFIVSTLPVAFIPTREAFVLYIPAVGLAISFTCLMVWLSDRVHLPIVSPASAILFIAVAGGLAFVHTGQKAIYQVELKQYPAVRQAWTQDLNKRGAWKRGDSILFLADPFPEDVWDPLFLTSLYRGDPKLTAARAKKNVMLLSPEAADLFSEIFDYRDGHLISVDKRNLPAIAAEEAKTEGYAEPQFGIYESTEAWWWTNKDFGIAARCPESKQVCKMEIRLVTPMGPFAPGEQRILGIDVDGKRQRDVPIAAQFDPISVTVDLPGGRDVAVVTHVGQEFTPDKLNGDERHLAIVVEGVHLN